MTAGTCLKELRLEQNGSGMIDRHSSAQGPFQYWQNKSLGSADGDGTEMNGRTIIDMTPQVSSHVINFPH